MKKQEQMNILVETFSYSESGPVLSLNIANGLAENGACVCAVVADQIENLDDWKRCFPADRLFVWKSYGNRYLDLAINGARAGAKFAGKKFAYALYPNPNNRDLLLGRFIRHDENIMILHDVVPHSGTADKFSAYIKGLIKKADNIMVLSKLFIPTVAEEYEKSENNIFYMRHGLMEYPKFHGVFTPEDESFSVNYLFFGRIELYKGLHVLSEAYRGLQSRYSNISLTVAGSGDFSDYEEEYRSLQNVRILNKYITDDEIAYLFSKPRTVVVLPYIDATQSGVVGMAYNYGTPILVTDTGGIREQLFDGTVGVFAQPGDAEDLREKMEQFLTQPDLYDAQRALMYESKEKMSWGYIAGELMEQLKVHAEGKKNK